MSISDLFIHRNITYTVSLNEEVRSVPPDRKILVLICQDARINPSDVLGLRYGEAHVIRNAGARAQDAIRSIVISQRMLNTTEIAVFHHTNCGMMRFTAEQLREVVKKDGTAEAVGLIEDFDVLEFSDPVKSVKEDVEYLKKHPLELKDSKITGWVYHVETGEITQVV